MSLFVHVLFVVSFVDFVVVLLLLSVVLYVFGSVLRELYVYVCACL